MREFSIVKAAPAIKRKLELIPHQPATLDFTQVLIVNREQLREALKDARHVSDILHNIENLDDLDWEEMNDLCRTAYYAARALAEMLEAKEANAQ